MAKTLSDRHMQALVDAGILTDPMTIYRVTIELQYGQIPVIKVEHVADERLFRLIEGMATDA